MFSTWDFVRPTIWHPIASMEQSIMDINDLTSRMRLAPTVPPPYFLTAAVGDDDEFFKDLLIGPAAQQEQNQASTNQESQEEQHTEHTSQKQNEGFSTYSFSTSSVVDEKGRRVSSSRRRYEDSTGLLKAVHERELDNKKFTTVWNRRKNDEKGEHKFICSSTTPEEFEKLWSETPFGKVHEKHLKETQEIPTEKPKPSRKESEESPHP